MQRNLIDYLPLWGLFVVTVAIVLLSLEVGFRIGTYRRRQPQHEHDAPVGSIVGAALALVGFMLAFTFGVAAERFDTRRALVVDDANAIEKTYLRAALLPEPNSTRIRDLLREYVDVAARISSDPEKVQQVIMQSEMLQKRLWSEAVTVSEKTSDSIMASLFIQSLNEIIDVRTKRINWVFRHRIPTSIWGALYLVSVLGMAAMGYQSGLSGARSLVPAFLLGLAFSAVILLIANLDRPPGTLSKVSQQAIIDLQIRISPK
jgi:hypothetical protein